MLALALAACGPARGAEPETNRSPLELDFQPVLTQSISCVENRFQVTIKNRSKEDVTIVKPLNGSLWSLLLPFYSFVVHDGEGRRLTMGRRHIVLGLWPDTKWPVDYLLVLKPGESFSRTFDLCFQIPSDGAYKVRFEYGMDPAEDPFKGELLDYPESAWRGTATSEEKEVRLRKQAF